MPVQEHWPPFHLRQWANSLQSIQSGFFTKELTDSDKIWCITKGKRLIMQEICIEEGWACLGPGGKKTS